MAGGRIAGGCDSSLERDGSAASFALCFSGSKNAARLVTAGAVAVAFMLFALTVSGAVACTISALIEALAGNSIEACKCFAAGSGVFSEERPIPAYGAARLAENGAEVAGKPANAAIGSSGFGLSEAVPSSGSTTTGRTGVNGDPAVESGAFIAADSGSCAAWSVIGGAGAIEIVSGSNSGAAGISVSSSIRVRNPVSGNRESPAEIGPDANSVAEATGVVLIFNIVAFCSISMRVPIFYGGFEYGGQGLPFIYRDLARLGKCSKNR